VFVGRLVRSKAVDMLVAAFNEIKEEATIELEIIGDGPERTALEKQVKELGFLRRDDENEYARSFPSDKGLEDRVVRFCGWLEQVDCARRLSNADGLVFPCLLECGGAAVLEAMASGLPVIAANWGGPADYVDESTGILIEPSSKESFIAGIREAMTTMIRNPELRRKMGGAGRQRVLDNFDWEANIDAMLEIYRESIARYRPPHTHSASNHEG
jgi:glycosyltransferase involved in cell wall biosynthesis